MAQNIDLLSIENHLLGQGVEFACFVNKYGRVIDCASKNAIYLPQEQKMFFMMNSLNLAMQGDYDDNFGTVQYIVTERKNYRIVSIPVPSGSIVLVMKKDVTPLFLVKKILKVIDYVRGLDDKLPRPENSGVIEEVKACL